jgi:hypothetical protein
MKPSETPSGSAADDNKDLEHAFFFYLAEKIVSRTERATGAEIKGMIKVVVPAFDTTHTLVLEGQGNHEDRVIGDTETVSLEVGHGQGPKHFYSKPPTNFGNA